MIRGMTCLVYRGSFLVRLFSLVTVVLFTASCSTTPHESAATEEDAFLATAGVNEVYERANAIFDEGNYPKAFDYYQAVLDREPAHLGAMVNSGLCARRLGDVNGALAWYDRALAIDPDDITALQNRILAGLLLGHVAESIPFAAHLTTVAAHDPAAWQQLGAIHLQLGHFREAAAALDRAVSLDPANPEYLYQLGLASAATEDLSAANENFTKALQIEPNLREAYPPQVHVLTLLGRYDEAWSYLSEGQTRGAVFDPDLILELQRLSGQVGPR